MMALRNTVRWSTLPLLILLLGWLPASGWAAGDLNLTTNLVDARTRQSTHFEQQGGMNQLFAMQQLLVKQIQQNFHISLPPATQQALNTPPTRSFQAFVAFSMGVDHLDKGNFVAARAAFRQAAKFDPGFQQAQEMERLTPLKNESLQEVKTSTNRKAKVNAVRQLQSKNLRQLMRPRQPPPPPPTQQQASANGQGNGQGEGGDKGQGQGEGGDKGQGQGEGGGKGQGDGGGKGQGEGGDKGQGDGGDKGQGQGEGGGKGQGEGGGKGQGEGKKGQQGQEVDFDALLTQTVNDVQQTVQTVVNLSQQVSQNPQDAVKLFRQAADKLGPDMALETVLVNMGQVDNNVLGQLMVDAVRKGISGQDAQRVIQNLEASGAGCP